METLAASPPPKTRHRFCAAPADAAAAERRPPANEGPQPDAAVLRSLRAEALAAAEALHAALAVRPERPYLKELTRLGWLLRRGDDAAAARARDAIPWVVDDERGVGGLIVFEARSPEVAAASNELNFALARLKVYRRHGLMPSR